MVETEFTDDYEEGMPIGICTCAYPECMVRIIYPKNTKERPYYCNQHREHMLARSGNEQLLTQKVKRVPKP